MTPAASRARIGRPSGRLDEADRSRLAATLGAELRHLRAIHGLSTRRLAERAAVARSTITRVERGERRVRRSLLANLAYGLAPDDPAPIIERLVCAADEWLVPESPWSERAHHKRLNAAIIAGRSPLPQRFAVPIRLHRAADRAWYRAVALFDEPGALDDSNVLDEIRAQFDEARRLRALAGPPFAIRIGWHEIRVGLSAL